MRDPKRIPEILHQLGKLWEKCPDVRLGQLLWNSLGTQDGHLFYVEDRKLLELVQRYVRANLRREREQRRSPHAFRDEEEEGI